jgi:hypothetical protein
MTMQNFRVISTFVNDLGEVFSDEVHSLALYERLLNKTTSGHTEAIEKHINSFKTFLTENEENILNRITPFVGIISYSPKVFIDMNEIMKLSKIDDETKDTIWRHLLTLSAIVGNSSKARDVLKERAKDNSALSIQSPKFDGEGEEDDFLNKIISKVESQVNPNVSDPQEAIGSLMNSNLIPELVTSLNTGISSGKLDLTKMISSVQKMVGNISGEANSDPNLANAMGMLNNMMGMMGTK